ncbi:MAG: type II CAAX prenyl endopeptidase Rce1 family protein [Promethearchaeota archaeon]
MRKLLIVEIENSYLNFFTPAAIVAIGHFLPNLTGWTLGVIEWLIDHYNVEVDILLTNAIIMNLSLLLACLVILLIFIPRLRVQDVDYKAVSVNGLFIVIPLFCFATVFRLLLIDLLKVFDKKIEYESPWFFICFKELDEPFLLLLFFLHASVTSNLFAELLFRRTIIPLMEDRGLSPFHAVILSSVGFSFLNLPNLLLHPNNPTHLFLLISYVFFGVCAGTIYILTRNILFPFIFHAFYFLHFYTNGLGIALDNEVFSEIYDLLNILAAVASLLIAIFLIWGVFYKKTSRDWINIIKKHSVPNIQRGIIGFFIFSIGLLCLQTLIERIGDLFIDKIYPEYFVFIIGVYFLAFSIPFWLTITTEYAQDR